MEREDEKKNKKSSPFTSQHTSSVTSDHLYPGDTSTQLIVVRVRTALYRGRQIVDVITDKFVILMSFQGRWSDGDNKKFNSEGQAQAIKLEER